MKQHLPLCRTLAFAFLLAIGTPIATAGEVPPALFDQAAHSGTVRVIVELRVATVPEAKIASDQAVAAQRKDIAAARAAVLKRLAGTGHRTMREYTTIPFVALEVTPDALAALAASTDVVGVVEDLLLGPTLNDTVPLIGADQAWAAGYDGSGFVVAVLDSGIESSHPFLAGKVIEEACFSANANCPNGLTTQTGPGAGVPCTYVPVHCAHGTVVAGVAAGAGAGFSGVAKGARLMSVQIFSQQTGSPCTGWGADPCALALTSDTVAGMERVYLLRAVHNFAAVNLSIGSLTTGGSGWVSPCDSALAAMTAVTENLRLAGIATIAASGNNGFPGALTWPACISSAVSVGSTTMVDTVSAFSNSASFLSLLAPGEEITTSLPGGGFSVNGWGTSYATPHVSGAWAILKQKKPTASVSEILNALVRTGRPVLDTRNGITKPRIQLNLALLDLSPGTPIPTLSGWLLVGLAGLLVAGGFSSLRSSVGARRTT
ncbi:Major intracellular serine protease [Burkholderiales bacterium]|nr:MAG: S8 family serine peptidase [Burkholderiales bacterium]CAG1002299.1 Major intracellular serine protease [Burkholderiales bacterium]